MENINEKFEKKSQAMVQITTNTKNNISKMEKMESKKAELKEKLKETKLLLNCKKIHQENDAKLMGVPPKLQNWANIKGTAK